MARRHAVVIILVACAALVGGCSLTDDTSRILQRVPKDPLPTVKLTLPMPPVTVRVPPPHPGDDLLITVDDITILIEDASVLRQSADEYAYGEGVEGVADAIRNKYADEVQEICTGWRALRVGTAESSEQQLINTIQSPRARRLASAIYDLVQDPQFDPNVPVDLLNVACSTQ